MATAGQDFGDYRAWLDAAGIDTSYVKVVDGKFMRVVFLQHRPANNQIASFYTGAMANAGGVVVPERHWARQGRPRDHLAQRSRTPWCSTPGVQHAWDSLHLGSRPAVHTYGRLAARAKASGAFVVIVNDYEFELLRQKTGMGEEEILTRRKCSW